MKVLIPSCSCILSICISTVGFSQKVIDTLGHRFELTEGNTEFDIVSDISRLQAIRSPVHSNDSLWRYSTFHRGNLLLTNTNELGYNAVEKILILKQFGITSANQAEYENGLEFLLEALALAERTNSFSYMPGLYFSLGSIYHKLGESRKAIDFFEQSMSGFNNDSTQLSLTFSNIALVYNELGEYQKSEEYLKIASEKCKQCECTEETLLNLHFALGDIKFRQGKLSNSQRSFLDALHLARKISNKPFEAECLLHLARVEISFQNNKGAIDLLKEAEVVSRKGGIRDIRRKVYESLAHVSISSDNYKQATYYQIMNRDMADSIHNLEVKRRLRALEVNFSERENNARIAFQKKIIELQQNAIINQKLIVVSVSFTGIVLVFLILLLRWNVDQKKMLNSTLTEKVRERTTLLYEKLSIIEQNERHERELILTTHSNVRRDITSLTHLCRAGVGEISNLALVSTYSKELEQLTESIERRLSVLSAEGVSDYNEG